MRGGVPPAQGEIIQELPALFDTGEVREVDEQRTPSSIRRWGKFDTAGIRKGARDFARGFRERFDEFALFGEDVLHVLAVNDREMLVSLKLIEQG